MSVEESKKSTFCCLLLDISIQRDSLSLRTISRAQVLELCAAESHIYVLHFYRHWFVLNCLIAWLIYPRVFFAFALVSDWIYLSLISRPDPIYNSTKMSRSGTWSIRVQTIEEYRKHESCFYFEFQTVPHRLILEKISSTNWIPLDRVPLELH